MSEKIIGYILLGGGILVIVLSAFSIYQIFLGGAHPVQIVTVPGVSVDVATLLGVPSAGGESLELLDSTTISYTTNLVLQIVIMGFLSTIGYKVAQLGIMLLRPVVIKVKPSQIKQ